MKLTIHLLLTFTLLSMIVGASVALDQNPRHENLIIAEAVPANTVTEDEAATIASKATGGQVISSETRGVEGVSVYRFRVLMSDGQVEIIQVKASSGEIL